MSSPDYCQNTVPIKGKEKNLRLSVEESNSGTHMLSPFGQQYFCYFVVQILKKPYIEAPGDDIEPSQAAEISWANHKKRNKSIMLELFDVCYIVL